MSQAQDPAVLLSQVAAVWGDLVESTPEAIRETVAQVVERDADAIARAFYDYMLKHDNAAVFLGHDIVKTRLHREMQRWLRALFQRPGQSVSNAQVAHQVAVGSVHARIKLPVELMSIGGFVLNRELVRAVESALPDSDQRTAATYYIMQLFSFATGLILSAFVRETQRGARNEEAYRQLLFRHDAALERERQRAALSEWAQRCVMALPSASRRAAIPPLGKSEFAQWLTHKGRALFEGVVELESVEAAMQQIDMAILPRLIAGGLDEDTYAALIDEFDSRIESIRYTLNDMFERVPKADTGRDAVTRLLNRRYLHSILAREIEAHAAGGQSFTLSLLRMAGIGAGSVSAEGEESRNALLQRVAVVLTEHAGAGDHVFRYTENDFLLLEVDSTLERSMARGQRLWHKLDKFIVAEGSAPGDVSIRIAVAIPDGHPDYQRLLRRVEFAAVSAAKTDQVVAA